MGKKGKEMESLFVSVGMAKRYGNPAKTVLALSLSGKLEKLWFSVA